MLEPWLRGSDTLSRDAHSGDATLLFSFISCPVSRGKEIFSYPLQGKSSHCVLRQCFRLQQSDLNITVHLWLIWPILTAFHLKRQNKKLRLENTGGLQQNDKGWRIWYFKWACHYISFIILPCMSMKVFKTDVLTAFWIKTSVVKMVVKTENLIHFLVAKLMKWKNSLLMYCKLGLFLHAYYRYTNC